MYGVHIDANLATPGQSIAESVLIASELRDTRTIIIVVTPWQLATSSTLNAQGWNAWWMYGLRPSPETRALVGMPEMSDAVERFRSRWIIRASFESMWRDGRADCRSLARQRNVRRRSASTRAHRIDRRAASDRRRPRAALAGRARALHGDRRAIHERAHDRRHRSPKPDEFIDATHPNAEGAKKLTRFIEERL